MKYIDAEKLTKLVKEWRNKQMGFAWDAVNKVLKIITSLQQEQPEVDLEKEIQIWCHNPLYELTKEQDTGKAPVKVLISDIEDTARHFYELGLNARKEE